jgi:hypothetical protein
MSDRSGDTGVNVEELGLGPIARSMVEGPKYDMLEDRPPGERPSLTMVKAVSEEVGISEQAAEQALTHFGGTTGLEGAAEVDNAVEKMAEYPGIDVSIAQALVCEFGEDEP